MKPMTKIWAHRGASAYAPENTLEAFELAAKMGADGVELDVHLSRDGALIVAHDDSVDRVSDGSGLIREMTLAQLKALDFGARFPAFRGARVPTLAEVFALLAPTGLTVNVELKTSPFAYAGIESQCVELAARMNMAARVIYSSFNHESLARVKALDASLPIGLLYSKSPEDTLAYARAQGAQAIHPYYPLMYEGGLMERVRAAGILVHPWTVDDPDDMRILISMGADALITNKPDLARTVARDAAGE